MDTLVFSAYVTVTNSSTLLLQLIPYVPNVVLLCLKYFLKIHMN